MGRDGLQHDPDVPQAHSVDSICRMGAQGVGSEAMITIIALLVVLFFLAFVLGACRIGTGDGEDRPGHAEAGGRGALFVWSAGVRGLTAIARLCRPSTSDGVRHGSNETRCTIPVFWWQINDGFHGG